MFQFFFKRSLFILYGIVVSTLLVHLLLAFPVSAHTTQPSAATPQVTLTGPNIGHPGTKVQIAGSGFAPSSAVALYTIATPDPAKCVNATDPVAAGLTPFSTTQSVTTLADGTFKVDTTWSQNAAISTTAYYICAFSATAKALSATTFTVAQALTIDQISPASVAPGGQVLITGSNWLPVQTLDVAIVGGNTPIAENKAVTPDVTGHFTVTLTIPATAPAQSYNVSVSALDETTLAKTQTNALTVMTAATPTPAVTNTPTPTDTPTMAATTAPTATSTTTATNTNNNNGNTGGTNPVITFLIFGLGGLGVILVIVGAIIFFASSRPKTV